MRARHVPYYVGGFMLLPYAFWMVLWATAIPGPKHGFEAPMSMALFAVSVPLVAWFFLSNLGFLSNSIAGRDAFQRPASGWVRLTIRILPAATLLIGLSSVAYLLAADKPLALALVPIPMALIIAWAIRRGEAARAHEGSRSGARASEPRVRNAGLVTRMGRMAADAVFLVPVLGWMLREAVQGTDEDRTFFALNLLLGLAVIVLLFGLPGLFVVALALAPIALLLIVLISRA